MVLNATILGCKYFLSQMSYHCFEEKGKMAQGSVQGHRRQRQHADLNTGLPDSVAQAHNYHVQTAPHWTTMAVHMGFVKVYWQVKRAKMLKQTRHGWGQGQSKG